MIDDDWMTNIPDMGATMRAMEDARRNDLDRQARNSGRYDAEDIFKHLMQRVRAFQSALDEDQEIGLQLANFGLPAQIHIRSISYRNPNLIEFHGVNADDHEVTLVQHISQLNFLLIAVKPIEETPYRIGF
jgi:Family of unknown function (DUF6173)